MTLLLLSLVFGGPAVAQESVWPAEGVAVELPAAGPLVNVIDAGAEPRHELKFAPKTGTTEKMSLSMDMTMSMKVMGMPMPAMPVPTLVLDHDVVVLEPTPSGNLRYRVEVVDVRVEGEGMVADQMKSQLDSSIRGLSTEVELTPSGRPVEVEYKLPAGANQADDQKAMENLQRQSSELCAPLPEQPIGVGGSWEVISKTENSGLEVFSRALYTVTSITGSSIDLALQLEQRLVDGKITQGLPSGADAEVQSFTSMGEGAMSLSVDKLVGVSSMKMVTDMSMAVTVAGAQNTMESVTTMEMKMSPL